MRFIKLFLFTSLMLLMQNVAVADTDTDTIKDTLSKKHNGLVIKSVQPSPIPGLYEVFAGGHILYVSKNAEYVLVGASMVEDATMKNLTSKRMQELTKIDFNTLPLQDAIEIKKGNGQYKFAVFSDPDCPYCKSLEQGIEKLGVTDYTAYVFLFPLEEIHHESRWKAESIWCAKDKAAMWHDWMVSEKALEKFNCDNPIDRNRDLGNKIGVDATPTIFMHDGSKTNQPQELVEAIKSQKSMN